MRDKRLKTRFWWEDLMERNHLEDQGVDRIILKWTFKTWDGEEWTRLFSFWTPGGERLWMRY
jgi:hypothetical protein